MKIKKAEDTSSVLTHPGHPETVCNMNFYKHTRGKKHIAGKIPKLMMKETNSLGILKLPKLQNGFGKQHLIMSEKHRQNVVNKRIIR